MGSSRRKVAIVTGASRGIGRATAIRLASDDYAVVINFHRSLEAANTAAQTIRRAGGEALVVEADVAVESDVQRLFDTTMSEFGRLDAVVNNAGIVAPQSRLADISVDRIDRLLATNVRGCLLCCREAVRRMGTDRGGNGGAIVNVSSVAARTGSPGEYIDYAASKGAIDSLTRGLATEVGSVGIRVNAVRPGFIHTDMHADGGEPGRVDRLASSLPLQRGGTPEEVAAAIAWLLSDEAAYATGNLLDLAGGR